MSAAEFSMQGRVALITGAGRGIGLSIARLLAKHGCAVAIQDIELPIAEEAAKEIVADGGKAIALGGDVLDSTLPKRLIAAVQEKFGALHVLVNNAAIQYYEDWLELKPEHMERVWQANLLTPILLCQLAARIFVAQRWGRIINLGSIQGKGGNSKMLPYAMSKAALENMTVTLARELAPNGITVNTLAPGYINTWRNREDFPTPEDLQRRGERIPVRRVGTPEDCAGAALLLCSEAGSYITGQTLYVDGGLSAR